MSMEELRKQLKENKIGKLYLFTGPEQYLIQYYRKEMEKRLLDENTKAFNYTVLDGKVSFNALTDAVSVFPAFSESRIIIVRESSFFKAGARDADWSGFFESLPDYVCLIFIQSEVDKRTALYKALKKYGLVVECEKQDEASLTKWVMKVFASYKKQIDEKEAAFMVGLLEPDMTFMLLEIEKVVNYMGENQRVTRDILLAVVSKSVKAKIFDLTDAISQNQMAKAIQIMNDLIELKEPLPFIMSMIARQMGILMKTKKMEEKRLSPADMAKVLGLQPFIVGKIRKQAASFSMDTLKQLTRKCLETDLAVKTGRMDGRLALDLFIVEMKK